MSAHQIQIIESKDITPREYAALLAGVGWEDANDYNAERLARSIAAYPFIAHARDADGMLVGYVSAFCDGAFSTMIGEVIVHPAVQGRGVGGQLLAAVERYADGVPVYIKAFADTGDFFRKHGYRAPGRAMSVLVKRTGRRGG